MAARATTAGSRSASVTASVILRMIGSGVPFGTANEMTPEEVDELIQGLGDDAAENWVFAARDAQLPPPD